MAEKVLKEIGSPIQIRTKQATFGLPVVLPEFMEGPPSGLARLTATEGSSKPRNLRRIPDLPKNQMCIFREVHLCGLSF